MRIRVFRFSESSLADEWEADDATKDDISKMQELFRMVFSRSSDSYYSFCYDDLLDNDSYWHCAICKRCDKWRTWHCEKCNKCKRFFVCFKIWEQLNRKFLFFFIFLQALTVRAYHVNDVVDHPQNQMMMSPIRRSFHSFD